MSASQQLGGGAKPIYLGRAMRTASLHPQPVREFGCLMMSECDNAVAIRNQLRLPMSRLGMFECLARLLMACQVVLFAALLSGSVGMRGKVVKFGGSLVVLVV